MRAAVGPPLHSRLCIGRVMHQRLRPARHRLGYQVYSLLLDLDETVALAKRLRLLSFERWNLFSVHQRDHGAGEPGGLRAHVERALASAGLAGGGAIRLLTMPRLLGHVFNPLSVYFCHRPDGVLQAILYEVDNTFGQRHSYLIEVDGDAADGGTIDGCTIKQCCTKSLYVSPFLGTDLQYRFRIRPPGAEASALSIGIDVHDAAGPVLVARFDARCTPLDDAGLLRAFFTHPLLTLKVVAAIHWEALRLWLKGVPLQDRPPAPDHTISVVPKSGPA